MADSNRNQDPEPPDAPGWLARQLPAAWRELLGGPLASPEFRALEQFVAQEDAGQQVFPPRPSIFAALAATPPNAVRAVLLGQDPYHDCGQAHGLCFSVPPGVPPPPSLRNILRELAADLGQPPPASGCLASWAAQGVLLLNTVLTVRAHAPASHAGHGWEAFTDAIIEAVNQHSPPPVIFMLWGSHAAAKRRLLDLQRHRLLTGAHPSPLSAYRGFLGSRPFSQANQLLAAAGRPPIDWRLPVAQELLFQPD